MRILILGGDGYLGWPTAMYLANKNNEVLVIDNYSRRKIAEEKKSLPLFNNINLVGRSNEFHKTTKKKISVKIFDCRNYYKLSKEIKKFQPDAIIHYAEQPSAPYSMADREKSFFTQQNNVLGNLNLLFANIH